MDYQPSLADIPTEPQAAPTSVGYQPSLSDIPEDQQTLNPNQLPWAIRTALTYLPSMARPASEAIPENIVNVGRGLTEIAQGAKQSGIGLGEYVGAVPYGTQADYQRKTEEERKLFESTPAAQDQYGKLLREQTTQAPFMIGAGGPLMLEKAGLLTKMLLSAAGGGAARNIEYRQPGEDRAVATLKGIGEGSLMNLFPEIPGLIGKGVNIYKGTKAALKADTSGMLKEYEQATAEHGQALNEKQQKIESAMTGEQPELRKSLEKAQADYEASQAKQAQLKTKLIEGQPELTANLEQTEAQRQAAIANKKQLEESLPENHPELTQKLETAQAEHQANLGQLTQAKSEAKQTPIKKADVDTMKADFDINQKKIANIDQQLAVEEKNVNPAQFFVDSPAEASSRLAKANATHEAAIQTVNDLKAQEKQFDNTVKPVVEKHDQAINQAESKVAEHLESGAEHRVKGARVIREDLEKNRKSISKDFDQLEANTAKQELKIKPESQKGAEEINASLLKLASEGKASSEEAVKLAEQLGKIGQSQKIMANEYIQAYRSTNGYMRDAYSKGYEAGRNVEEQAHWRGVGKELEGKLAEMDKVLESSLPVKDYELFKSTAARWRSEIVPLYKNPTYHQIMNTKEAGQGKMPANMMEAISGDDPGNVLLRNIVQKNPQALKHVVGQKYDSQAGRALIHNPNEQVGGYVNKMPELQQLTAAKREAELLKQNSLGQVEQQKAALSQAREKAEAVQARAKNHVDMQREAKTAADAMKKDYDTKINNIKNLQQQKNSLTQTNQLLDKHITQLKESMNNIKQSDQKVKAAQAEIRAAEQKRLDELNKAQKEIELLQQRAEQTKGLIKSNKQSLGKELQQESVSGQLIKQSMTKVQNEIKAIEQKRKLELQKASVNAQLTKQKMQNLDEQIKRAEKRKSEVWSKLKTIGWIAAALTGTYSAAKVLKAASTAASLPGEE